MDTFIDDDLAGSSLVCDMGDKAFSAYLSFQTSRRRNTAR